MNRASIVVAQIRGAEYAALEIVWWMVASLLAGILIGWIVRGFRAGRRLEAEYRERLETADAARTDAVAQQKKAEGHLVAAVGDLEASRGELATAQSRIAELEAAQSTRDDETDPEPAATDDPAAVEAVDDPGDDPAETIAETVSEDDQMSLIEPESGSVDRSETAAEPEIDAESADS